MAYSQAEFEESIRKQLTPYKIATYLARDYDQGGSDDAGTYRTDTLVANTPTKINIPTTVSSSNGFAYDSTNDRFYLSESDVTDQTFVLHASTSLAASTSNTEAVIMIYINGSLYNSAGIERKISSAGDIGATPLSGVELTLSTDDYIEIYVEADSAGELLFSWTNISLREVN